MTTGFAPPMNSNYSVGYSPPAVVNKPSTSAYNVMTYTNGSHIYVNVTQYGSLKLSGVSVENASPGWTLVTPAVSVDTNGDFVIAYAARNQSTGATQISAEAFTHSGSTWYYATQKPVIVGSSSSASTVLSEPDVLLLGSGGQYAVSLLQQNSNGTSTLFMTEMNGLSATGHGNATTIATEPTSSALQWPTLQVSTDGKTSVLVDWHANGSQQANFFKTFDNYL